MSLQHLESGSDSSFLNLVPFVQCFIRLYSPLSFKFLAVGSLLLHPLLRYLCQPVESAENNEHSMATKREYIDQNNRRKC